MNIKKKIIIPAISGRTEFFSGSTSPLFLNPSISGITSFDGKHFTLDFPLLSTYDDIGIYNEPEETNTITSGVSGMSEFFNSSWLLGYDYYVTGFTESKLNLVKTYSLSNPYQIGVNGVTNITTDYIDYALSGGFFTIYYRTFLNDGTTEFNAHSGGLSFANNVNINQIFKEDGKLGMVFPPNIIDEIDIDRGLLSIFDKHQELDLISNSGELFFK